MKLRHSFISVTSAIWLSLTFPADAQVFNKSWDHTFGGDKNDLVSVVRAIPGAGFIIGGSSFSGISADKTESNHDTSLSTADYWLVMTDPSGNKIWDRRFGGPGAEDHFETILLPDGFLSGGHSFSPSGNDVTEDNRDSTISSNDYWIVKIGFNGQKIWDKRFGGTSFENFGSVRLTPDGGLIIAGSSFSDVGGDKTEPGQGGWDYWLVRTDSMGNKIWDRRFGGTADDFATAVEIVPDGNYLVGGYSGSGAGGDKTDTCRGGTDYWIVKVDDSGNLLWDKTFGGSNNDWLFSLAISTDDGLLIGGQSFSPVSGEKTEANHDPAPSGSDRWVIKSDAAGMKLWDRTYGADQTEDLNQIIPGPDGGFLVTGESYSQANGDKTEPNLGIEQTWILKADSMGTVLWDKTIFTLGHDESGYVVTDGPDCFVVVNFCTADTGGYKSEDSKGYGDYFMIRMCLDTALAIQQPGEPGEWKIWPNPAGDMITLEIPNDAVILNMEVIDITGKQCAIFDDVPSTHRRREISLDGLPSGWYCARIRTRDGVVNLPILKSGTGR
jgi:hypothetical protein